MKNQYEYTINSTEDISRALADAESNGYDLTHYNSAFYLRGTASESISVDDSLANLHVVAYGPAPVWVSGEGDTTVIAEESAVVYAIERGVVDAYESSTVYAYGRSTVVVQMGRPCMWHPTTWTWRPGATPRCTSPPQAWTDLKPEYVWKATPESSEASTCPGTLPTNRRIQ